jgi:hypothetical protein
MYAMNSPVITIHYTQSDTLQFSGPYRLDSQYFPEIPAVYAILAKNMYKTVHEVVYVGQTGNLAERGFPRCHHAYNRWVHEARGRQLSIAYLPAYTLTDADRRQLESAIIHTYNPPANRTLDLFPRR